MADNKKSTDRVAGVFVTRAIGPQLPLIGELFKLPILGPLALVAAAGPVGNALHPVLKPVEKAASWLGGRFKIRHRTSDKDRANAVTFHDNADGKGATFVVVTKAADDTALREILAHAVQQTEPPSEKRFSMAVKAPNDQGFTDIVAEHGKLFMIKLGAFEQTTQVEIKLDQLVKASNDGRFLMLLNPATDQAFLNAFQKLKLGQKKDLFAATPAPAAPVTGLSSAPTKFETFKPFQPEPPAALPATVTAPIMPSMSTPPSLTPEEIKYGIGYSVMASTLADLAVEQWYTAEQMHNGAHRTKDWQELVNLDANGPAQFIAALLKKSTDPGNLLYDFDDKKTLVKTLTDYLKDMRAQNPAMFKTVSNFLDAYNAPEDTNMLRDKQFALRSGVPVEYKQEEDKAAARVASQQPVNAGHASSAALTDDRRLVVTKNGHFTV